MNEAIKEARKNGRDELAEALEEIVNNQRKWATIGAHTAEVPNFDTDESYRLISAFNAGRLYEQEEAL